MPLLAAVNPGPQQQPRPCTNSMTNPPPSQHGPHPDHGQQQHLWDLGQLRQTARPGGRATAGCDRSDRIRDREGRTAQPVPGEVEEGEWWQG